MRYATLLALCLAAACESSTDKALRLRQASLADCLGPDLTAEGKFNSSPDEIAKCDASRRAYNRFLNGR